MVSRNSRADLLVSVVIACCLSLSVARCYHLLVTVSTSYCSHDGNFIVSWEWAQSTQYSE